MKKALILHVWYSNPNTNWYQWLQTKLEEKGYEVWLPELPTMSTSFPDMETMLKFVLEKNFIDESTLVVGHSLGAVLALRLAERVRFGKGILLAVWDYNDLTPEHQSFWKNMMDHKKIMDNVKEWVLLISDNDPYVTKAIAQEVAGRVKGLAVDVGSRGHFGEKDGINEVPEIIPYI